MMILILLIIGFGAYYLLKDSKKTNFTSTKREDPIDILKLRYVNGEIDDETYTRMLKALKD